VWYVENGATPNRTHHQFSIERGCATECQDFFIMMGDKTKLEVSFFYSSPLIYCIFSLSLFVYVRCKPDATNIQGWFGPLIQDTYRVAMSGYNMDLEFDSYLENRKGLDQKLMFYL
jgi:hypothetical protein